MASTFDKILLPKDVSNPQHISFQARSSPLRDGLPVLIYVYTGILNVGHGAGNTGTTLKVGFPLIGFFGRPGNSRNSRMGILDIQDVPNFSGPRFEGAVATVSLASVDSDGNSRVGVDFMHADLRPVVLKPSDRSIKSVVLSVSIEAQRGLVGWVGYQVTVMLNQPFPAPDPIIVGSPDWDGTYADVGDIFLPGVPQP